MADDALKFRVDLAGNMAQELVASGKAANVAEGNVQALTGAILALTEASKKKESSFFTFDLAKGAEMAIGFVETLTGKVWDLGKRIVGVVSNTQNLNVALESNVGKAGVAAVNALASSFQDTEYGAGRIKQELLPLLERGLGKDNPKLLHDITTAATDIAARENDPAKVGEVLDAFKRIHTKREVNARMLERLGVNEKDFFGALGETIGKSSKEGSGASKTKSAVEEFVAAGKVSSETLMAELLAQIAAREGGALGTATTARAGTFGTAIARLERLPDSMFARLADNPGLALMKDRINEFVDKMVARAPEIVNTLGKVIDKIGGALFGDGDAVDHLITTISEGIPKAVAFMGDLWDVAKSIVGTMKDIIQAFRDAGNAIDKWEDNNHGIQGRVDAGGGKQVLLDDKARQELVQQGGRGWWESYLGSHRTLNAIAGVAGEGYDFTAQDKWVQEQFQARVAGMNVGQGHADGIMASMPVVQDAAANLASCAISSVDTTLKNGSPSKVMIERGGFAGEGFALGVEGSVDRVRSASRMALADAVMSNAGDPAASSRGGGSSMTFVWSPVYQLPAGSTEEAIRRADAQGRIEFARLIDEARFARLGAAA